jgi:iron complex outermembrane receptor protein
MLTIKLKHAATFLFLLIFGLNSFGQTKNGTIQGTVKTSDGVSAAQVTIVIKGVANTTSDRRGNYTLKNIPAGNYTITASLVGVNPVSQEVTVTAGQSTESLITLTASNQQLKEVVVTGGKTNKFAVKESDYVSKMPLKNLENPQVYTVISKELLSEQVVTNYDDALKNAPGIDKLWSSTGRNSDGAGYFTLRGFAVQPTLVNGLPGLTNGSLDVSNVERIEIIKGPSGTLFGSSLVSYGGLINTVTKQPFDGTAGEVNYAVGSYGLQRISADFNTPLDKNRKLLFRLNAAYQDEDSFQDAGFKKSRFIAPSLSYKVNDRLSFLLNTQFLSYKSTTATMLFFNRAASLRTNNLAGLGYDPDKSYTSNDLSVKNPVSSGQFQMNYKISDAWHSQTLFTVGTAKSDGFYSYLYENAYDRTNPAYPNVPSNFSRYTSNLNSNTKTTDVQQNFIGDFNIGSVRNRMIVGFDYFNRTFIDHSSNYNKVGEVTLGENGSDTGVLTYDNVFALTDATGYVNNKTTQEVYSAYVSDVINFTPQFSAMLSLRVDRFKNGGYSVADADKFGQTALSPKFGLVYQVIQDKVSLFGNFMNGFTNSAPRSVNAGGVTTTRTFDPEQANQFEGGVKADLFEGKLTGSLSYYDIKVSNTILSVGENDFSQGGKNYSKGFEAEIAANPFPGFNIIAGYSLNSSKLTDGDAEYEGRRPEGAGPRNLANAWFSYKILTGTVKGLGFGFGGNYASSNSIVNRATMGVFTVPSYTVLNAAVSYSMRHFNFGAKLDNLTDKQYYKGWSTLEPMRTRTIIGTVGYRF